MRDTICTIRDFVIYLAPASLLATAGMLATALLYDPVSSVAPSRALHTAAVADHEYGPSHAEALFTAMVTDALRQIQEERDSQARTLQYRYERPLHSVERPVAPLAPPLTWSNGDAADRPLLIYL